MITPLTVNIPIPTEYNYQLGDLPELKSIDYSYLDTHINISDVSYNQILSEYYTVLYKAILEDKVDELYNILTEVSENIEAEFNYEKYKLMRKYATSIDSVASSFGSLQHNIFQGRMIKNIRELHTSEQLDANELIAKFKDKAKSIFMSYIPKLNNLVKNANSLYFDIYEKDFRITQEAHLEWINYISSQYDKQLSEFKLQLEQQRLNLQIFGEKIENAKRQLAYIKEEVEASVLNNTQRQKFNEFISYQTKYLMELERFNYLDYELLQVLNRKYSAELKKFSVEIDKINTIAKFINENLNKYLLKLDIAETEQNINRAKIDVFNSQMAVEKIRLSAYNEKIDALYRKYRALYDIEKTKLDVYETDLAVLETDIINTSISYSKELQNKLLEYINARRDILDYIEAEAQAKNSYTFNDMSVRLDLQRESQLIRNTVTGNTEFISITSRSVADWYRTCALTSAQITAAFIRSYS